MSNLLKVKTDFLQIDSLSLHSGKTLSPVNIAYETYGELNKNKNNAILVFHALSGSQHAAGLNKFAPSEFWSEENHVGWWDEFIGPGKIIDTNKFFVICGNCLGGCYGSTGPSSINLKTKKPYGGSFPKLTLTDLVYAQKKLVDHFGIATLHAVIGGSLGGMEALEYMLHYPVNKIISIGSCARMSTLNKIMNFEQIFAIEEDHDFNKGDYYDGNPPVKGLQLARMIAHKTYVDVVSLEQRARGEIIQEESDLKLYELMHRIESYMLHQGKKFVKRFDANTYLWIVQAIQSFNLARQYGNGDLKKAFARLTGKQINILIISISSDVSFYPEEQQEIVEALNHNKIPNTYVMVGSDKGHDSFLLEPEKYLSIREFLEN